MSEPSPAEADRAPREEGVGIARLALELVGLAAGIAVFVNYVGAFVVTAEFHALRLPSDSIVSLLPPEIIIAAGLRLLIPSIILGIVVVALVGVLGVCGVERGAWLSRTSRVALGVAAAVIVVWVLVRFLGEPVTAGKERLGVVVAIAVAGMAALAVARGPSLRGIGATLFGLLALLTGTLGYLRASDPPVDLDFAVLTMRDGGRTSGFLLGRSSDSVVLAPDADNRTISRVAVIPRDDVVDLRVAPGPRGAVRPLDLDYPPVGAELPRPTSGNQAVVVLRTQRYLAGVRGSTLWKYPPIMFARSIGLWQHHYAEFAVDEPHPWTPRGVRTRLSELNEEPNLYDNKYLIVRGRLVDVTRPLAVDATEDDGDRVVKQILVLQSRDQDFRAICPVAARRAFAPGTEVDVRGILIAAGAAVDGSGRVRHRVALVCSAVRPVGA
ncbi:MAG TPA: hypothetical protein VNT55_01690 [Baekduia sp.]|nr:hypothetical protein [Baekduia sp.]